MIITPSAVTQPVRRSLISSGWRNAGGGVAAVPAISDGNRGVYVLDFNGASYQFVTGTLDQPCDYIDITALHTVARALPATVSFTIAGKSVQVSADIRTDFPVGKKITRRYEAPSPSVTWTLNTPGCAGRLVFYEIAGFSLTP